ncbi:NYN domain-containing protein [Candidatus Uhrbacteria bacterium]|nr:NYN domain-containing protein [Candidatus Uhrbacteria bacterium]
MEQQSGQHPVTYAFVDAANIIYRESDTQSWKIDLKKLLAYLQERFGASKVFYYGGADGRNRIQRSIYEKMAQWGYVLCLNPVKYFINNRGEEYRKADVDSRMTFDMMRLFAEYDRAVVLTGDGDFSGFLSIFSNESSACGCLRVLKKLQKSLRNSSVRILQTSIISG